MPKPALGYDLIHIRPKVVTQVCFLVLILGKRAFIRILLSRISEFESPVVVLSHTPVCAAVSVAVGEVPVANRRMLGGADVRIGLFGLVEEFHGGYLAIVREIF